jgi:hypothetical protein
MADPVEDRVERVADAPNRVFTDIDGIEQTTRRRTANAFHADFYLETTAQ